MDLVLHILGIIALVLGIVVVGGAALLLLLFSGPGNPFR